MKSLPNIHADNALKYFFSILLSHVQLLGVRDEGRAQGLWILSQRDIFPSGEQAGPVHTSQEQRILLLSRKFAI